MVSLLNFPTPKNIHFFTSEQGKPYLSLQQNTLQLDFNLSHSLDYIVIAVTQYHSIGIDIEWMGKPLDYINIAKRFFTAKEYHSLTALPEPLQKKRFYQTWVCKEALIKASSGTLFTSLNNVEILFNKFDLPYIDQPSWSLISLPCQNQYIGTLAVNHQKNVNC